VRSRRIPSSKALRGVNAGSGLGFVDWPKTRPSQGWRIVGELGV
jgi:hypothetical protein